MADKPKETAGGVPGTEFAKTVRESAHQIWLAGLGAYAKTQEEGTKVFNALVKEGEALQKRTSHAAEAGVGEMTRAAGKLASEAQSRATQTWDKLEQVFELRVERALNRLGVPSKKDIDHLARRVEQLTSAIEAMGKSRRKKAGGRSSG